MNKLLIIFLLFFSFQVFADTVVNNSCPQYKRDKRMAPQGTYSTSNPDGSGSDVYTTGENVPYNADGNCGQSSTSAQPFVFTPAPR